MLTQLRFKNWRSLKDVTIDDLQPINVFIGANSSGKTNILDALYFLRHAVGRSIIEAFSKRIKPNLSRTIGIPLIEPLELELSFKSQAKSDLLTYLFSEQKVEDNGIRFIEKLWSADGKVSLERDGTHVEAQTKNNEITSAELLLDDLALLAFGRLSMYPEIQQTFQYITQRWQMLDENFMPCLSIQAGSGGDPYLIDKCADNVPFMLDFMHKNHPKSYSDLQEDFSSMVRHVEVVETEQTEYETRMLIREKFYKDQEAPTISAGTARLLAMLTAYYALDMRLPEMPGLIVIEEPDTALNPGILGKFVSQLRDYVTREHPRQFILTTHNPSFLDYFEPEEVRVVERDEQGYTQVKRIPEHVREIWLDEYGLGEVWTTRSLGGVPE